MTANPKRRWTLLLALLALSGAAAFGWAMRRRGASPPKDHSAVLAPQAVTLASGVHLLGELAPGAAYVIETTDGLIMIDSGVEASAGLIAKQLKDLGLELNDLRMVLISHVHGDHSLGARRLRELTGAKLYAGAGDAAEIEQGGPRDAFFSTFYAPHIRTHSTRLDVQLHGGEVIELGDARVEVLPTPGHTPGSLCFLLKQDDQRLLFTGDTVCTLTSVIGTYAAHLSPRYRGSASDYLTSLKKLRSLPTPDLILPGHPRMGKTHQRARLTEAQWHGLLDGGISEMQELLGRYEVDGLDFLDGEPRELLPGLYYLGDFDEQAVYCLKEQDQYFCINAPGGAGLLDFVKRRLATFDADIERLAAVLLTSFDEQSHAGLMELVEATGCAVAAPPTALESVKQRCPPGAKVLSTGDVSELLSAQVEAIQLQGVGHSPVAYQIEWKENTVLATGGVPTQASGEEEMQRLVGQLRDASGDSQQYMNSIHTLQKLAPDLWLPARPVQGQNANLYGSKWQDALQNCLEVVFYLRSQ